MNPTEFHKRLTDYSMATNPEDLADKVLGHQLASNVNEETAMKVGQTLNDFLENNQGFLDKEDLPALHGLVHKLETWTDGIVRKGENDPLTTLEKTITESIKLLNTSPMNFPDSIYSLITEYLPLTVLIELTLERPPHPTVLDSSINDALEEDFEEFIKHLFKAYQSDQPKFERMINIFFKYASPETQKHFLESSQRELKTSPYNLVKNILNSIMTSLPKNITHFELGGWQGFDIVHANYLLNNFHHLKSLNLSASNECTKLIANSPLAAQLENLNITINHEKDILEIAKFTNLRQLQLSGPITAITAITQSLNKLEELTLSCYATNRQNTLHSNLANTIAGSSQMPNLKKCALNYIYGNATVGVKAIADSPHRVGLKSLTLTGVEDNAQLDYEAIEAITSKMGLESLALVNFRLPPGAAPAIAISSMTSLRELTLQNCGLKDREFAEIVNSAGMANLIKLNVDQSPITDPDAAAQAIIDSQHMKHLQNVGLDNLSPESEQSLEEFLKRNYTTALYEEMD
jgi:hypothetical protein